ncbi:hydrocephalus-inducing protein homolog isoform X5 [Hydra vulgaris]|uniref:Hydrocephalus-inducing protein homolog isoform X5 n=1 Tax=Hydra vulgaris TaxID=6087 RepID=A0ABM4DKA8_HYDVU
MAPLKLKQKPFGYENKNSKRSKENSSNVKLSPSAYLADMKLSTDELWKKTFKTKSPEIVELFDYSEVTLQKASTVPIDCPLFQHFPSQIIFQNFDAFDVYQVPLQLQNRDNVARFVKLVLKDSPYFTIVNPAGMSSKVAPGIEVIYYIKFTPLEKKDYVHEVICITEREKFLIPIKAIGPRGFLDFPDQVYFGNVPVKYETTKILLVRNIGDAAVKFQLLADKPFFLQPDNGVLEVSQSMQIHVKVNPQINGSFNKSLIVHYDTGEDVYISMFVDAEDINIRLDKNTIKLENTYITSSSRRSLMLFNRSEFVINFSWKTFATTAEEEQQKNLRFKQLNASISDDAFLKECVSDPTMRDKLSLVVRSLKNQIGISNYDKMLYEDENIIIEPLEGEIWPNSSIEIFVIFKPSEAKHYSCIIYCDVSGRETRLPLRVQGEGVGPKIEFSYDVLDIQNVFINSCHMYELIVTNKGHIDAPFSYLPGDKLRTNQFEFSPEVGVVKVGECQTIQIKLYSINLGEFMEHFSWLVGSSNEKSIAIRGCVIGPTFHFDVIKLRFGLISYGFTYEKSCRLINTSSVPISFCLTFPSDGRGICAAEHVKTGDFDLPYFPKEFEVIPSNGSLCPFSDIQIQIRFTPLSSGSYKTFLAVEVDGLGDYIFKLPVSARSIIPSIDLLTPLLDFGRCFINYQYENFIELHNSSDFLASYEIQVETEDNTTIACLLPKGIIECRSTCKIPIQFTLRSVVNISTVIKIQIFGCLDQVKEVTLKARGEGPVIYIDKPDIDFGNIAVLQDATCNLQLSNESPIPAHVNCKMLHLNSPFHVEPFSVLIDSHSKIMLKVIANVNDNVRFQDKVIIYVTNGQTYVITLKANGQGSTIITEPSISPMWDVGPHLCCYNYTQKFRFYNKGKRVQQVYWRTKGFSSSKLKHKKKLSADNVNFKSSCGEASIFKLTPNSFSIGPGKYQDVYLEGYSDSAKFVKEKLFCQAIIGSNSYKENIMNVEVVANFIQPLLEFSEKTINFNIIKLPDEALTLERKLVKIKNISLLPLTSSILVEYPFQLNLAYTNTSPKIDFIENSTPSIASLTENVSSTAGSTKNCTTSKVDFTLGTNQELVLNVHFDPSSRNDKISWSIESLMTVYYKDHPRTDCISLKGEVHFPNLIFEKNKINFETVTNDTEHIQMVKVTNMSPLDVTYSWIFSHHDISFKKEEIKDKDEITICVDQSCISIGFSTNEETNLVTSDDYSISMADKTLYEVDSFSVTDKKFCHEIGIEEVFDIFPLFGCLKPKETLNFQFSFYGHPFIVANAVATCSVEEGPEYNVFLSGEASLISYKLNTNEVVLGKILYDQATTYDVQLFNTGSLKFEYHIHQCESSSFLAVAKIFPMKGVLSAGDVAKLTIQCVPIVPQDFEIYIMVQVAHFPSEKITIKGTGVFPHIIFNLPKDDQSAQYKHLHAQAMESLSKQKIFFTDGSEINEIDIQAEIDRLEIKQLVLGKLNNMAETSQSVCTIMGKSQRPSLTEYILDFGPVIYGSVVRKMFQVINIGHLPVSFYAEHKCILKTGFSVKLDPVKGLPGYPHNEHLEFEAVFSPQSEKLSVGPIQTVLPIKVLKGPTFNLCFKAFVTIPDASLSVNFVEFGEVICGQCKLIALQIKNTSNVFCHWHFLQDLENKKSLNKKTARAPSQVSIFELLPSSGFLLPGQSQNVNVKFMPREEANYSKKLFIKLSQSTIQPFISCKGTGKEPHIELDNKVLIFPPVLPFCGKAEVIVKVTNPCTFPVEFYSLEFDKQYLEEEKILQSLHCYDDNNMTLLPPRHPGDSLPKEILAYWEKSHKSAENSPRESPVNNNSPTFNLNENDKKDTGVGDLEVTPVASAIASYLGIDISFDINSNHHSLCVIIHGPPLSGKTATAIELSKFYNAAVIKIDEIVIQSIKSGTSVAAIRARELCSAAARLTKLNKDPVINNEPKALSLLPNASADFGLPGIASKSPSNRGFPIAKVGKKNPPTLHMLPNVNFVSKKLDINFGLDCVEEEFYNCILPEDILIKLLSERMQATDCATGIIFDGLESLFINDITTGAKIVLKAINNRKHIYAITLKLDFETVKDINEKKKYEHELQLQTAEKKEWDMLEEMNEDEYDALSNEDRKVIDQKRLLLKLSKYNKKKELKAKKIKEKLEKELEEKKKEEERSNKKKKNINQNKIRDKKSQDKFVLDIAGNKSTNDAFTAETNLSVDRHSSCNDDIEKKKNGSRGAQVKSALVKDLTVPLIDGKEELESPEDKDLRLSFKPYELSLHDIIKLLDGWDRTVGNAIESEENENDIFEHSINIQTLSKKNEKKKQLEKERRKEIVESVAASVGNNGEFPSELNTRLKDGIGIPHIMIQLKGLQQSCFKEVFDTKILPEIKEVAHDVSLKNLLPPFPFDTLFSVISCPVFRQAPPVNESNHLFTILMTEEKDVDLVNGDKNDVVEKNIEKKESKKQSKCKVEKIPSVTVKKGRHSSLAPTKSESPPSVAVSPDKKRKETRVVFLRNKTLLPAAWKLSGMENIGDDFTVNSTSGIIEPMSEFELQMHFRAIKAISVKKIVRVEVSDGDNVLGLSHAENITVIAEAYDIALDLSFPKGADGILDFGTLKVGDEAKLVCTLKNKGRYEISFSFLLENINGSKENINKILSVIPNKGVLLPNERPSQIQINFISHKEISISDMPILKCQVIEPNMGENGEIIACIPVKVSAKSIFSKYTISPGREINFGAVVVNTKKTRTFTIENKSQFDFRFNILKPQAKTVSSSQHTSSFSKIRSQRESFKGNEINVAPTGIVGGHNIKSNFGIFSVNPSNGIVAALNGSCVVTVDMISEIPMIGLEDVVIDISDRDPEDHPGGIEFRFVGEVCLPSILSLPNGASSIFEEHRIIKSFNTMSPVHDFASKTCIYVEDDNRFFIHNVIVGHVANVKFKITNSNKIPCDVVFSLKPISNKSVHKIIDVFEINMQRASIFPQSTTYVVVSFQPQAIQQYSCVFEAVVDGLSASISNGRNITFDIIGDGVLPHISILKPITTNLQGTPIIVFQRLILGHCQRAQVVLKNDGLLSCKCHIKLVDPNKSYFIHLKNKEAKMLDFPDNHTKQISSAVSGDFSILSIAINETIEFSVEFVPNMVAKHVANIQIRVEDNPFEDILIEILGEGYYQEFTIENINQVIDWQSHQKHDSQQDTEAIAVQSSNQIIYGDCHVGVSKSITFTVCNRSSTDPMRFFWDSIPELTFKPKCGHVQPNCTKDITVTYLSNLPQVLDHVNILCRVSKISLVNKKVLDWDDTKQVICWIDDIASEGSQSINTEEVSRNKQKKIVQIEEEPAYTVIPGSLLDTDLVFLVNCHYSKYQMGTEKINFKETYILQTRFYSFKLANVGLVSFEYNWNIVQGIYEPLISSIQSDTLSDLTVEQKKGMKSSHKVTIATNSNNSQISWQSNQPEQAKSVLTSNTNETNTLFECIKSLASTQILSGLSADERPVNKITSVYEAELLKRFQSISTANIPFTIEPLFGTILAGEEVSFTVRFSPVEIGDFNAILFMSIDNLDPSLKKPIISLHGQSALPWCHFELKESNYIIERRNPEQKGTVGLILDHNTKVIEFESCGVSNIIRKFFIMNPTDTSYNYTWLLEQHPGNSLSNFVCKTMTGCIQPGMKTEIVFEYKMDVFELKESLWQFIIKEHGVSVPFLLVAYGREPSVTFDRSNVNFKQVLTGLSVSQQVFLHNNEDQAFSFKFEKSSLQPTLPMATFLIEPNKGKIEPKNKIPITLTYKTESEGELNLNVKCKIGQKTNPLILNVKAEGVSFNVDIYCEDSSGNKIKLSSNGLNLINFLNVEINDKAIRHIHIENSSKFNLDFLWIVKSKTFKKKKSISCVKVIPDTGTVLKNTKQLCQVSFTPSYVMTLEDCKAFLKISNGPTYQLSLTGNGVLPAIKFSFTSYNFGPCFLYRSGATIMKKILHITNEDTKEISVECLYSNTSHLEIHFPPVIIFPGETKESEICFYPRDVKYYNEQVVFEINSLSPIYLSVCGQGIEMMVEVLNPVDRKVNLGFLRVNEKVSKSVRIVNNSLAAVDCTFALTAATLTLQSQNIIGLSPKSSVNLQSKATFDITIYFHPKFRISQFYEEVIMDCAGTSQPLFSIVGGCHGTDVKLDSESISFGSVTLGSFSIRKLVMTNDGDIGSNFSWDTKKLKSGFSIFPTNGYISSGMEVRFEITFNPSKESQEIRSDDFRCNLEDGNFLLLNLVGSCIPRIPMKDSIYFISHVRNRDAKAVFIHNKTNHLWTLKPVIDGEYWSGAETFVVEPQENKPYEIVYRPLTMTQETKKHNGSIFFPLPDGSGLLYNLVGTSEAPKPINNIVREVPCKIPCTELLNVSNWLKKPQRFHVIFEMIKPEKSDPATKIGGAEHIDVPGLSKKEYKVNFFAHKEGIWSTKVTFKNEASGEYLFYCLTFKVLAPGAVCCIDLTTTVRQSVTHVITINNPLLSIVNFQTSCNLQEVNLPPQFVIPAQSEGSFTFEYLPLKSGTTTGRLNLQSFDLGVYIYDLNLIANSALPERAVHFTAALGVSQVQTCKFINYARTRTEYSVKVDSSDFIVDKTVNAPSSLGGGTEVSLDVTYEPSRLGNSETTLILTSTVGGEYVFPLFGHCLLPKPQGPFTVKANGSTQIPFKNIFSQTISFTFYLDNPLFSTKSGEVIKPKKSYNIVVSFNGNQSDSKSVSLARLLVTCARGAGSGTNLSWTFYLKGVY